MTDQEREEMNAKIKAVKERFGAATSSLSVSNGDVLVLKIPKCNWGNLSEIEDAHTAMKQLRGWFKDKGVTVQYFVIPDDYDLSLFREIMGEPL